MGQTNKKKNLTGAYGYRIIFTYLLIDNKLKSNQKKG